MKKTSPKMNIDKLASLMEKGFKKQDNNLENLAVMVAKNFGIQDEKFKKMDERFDRLDNRVKLFQSETEENFKKARPVDMLAFSDRFVSQHQFDSVLNRLNTLEAKAKTRK